MKCENCGAPCSVAYCPYCNTAQNSEIAQGHLAAQEKTASDIASLEGKLKYLKNSYEHAPSHVLDKKIKLIEQSLLELKR